MELWNMLINIRPDESNKATISETFTSEVACINALSGWFGKDKIPAITEENGAKRFTGENFEARITPCRFGVCLALAEWGFVNEEERLAARKEWVERFNSLKKEA